MTTPEVTSHKDLMDLASRYAYWLPGDLENKGADVNGRTFTLVNQVHDPVTGLDAFTFRNPQTGEVTVAFQGTVTGGEHGTTDLWTDAMLVTSLTPGQYTAALAYVDRMGREVGRVGSVCGNSLGGGLAAYVGAHRPGVTAVTVNPAPVPRKLAGAPADNVHNYLTSTDVLRRVLRGAELSDGVLGRVVEVEGTGFGFGALVANHVGSDRETGPYDASMAVPFSLFHPDTVVGAGAFGPRVEVTPEALAGMVAGLERQRAELVAILLAELKGAALDLAGYARDLAAREDEARQAIVDTVDAAYAPVRSVLDTLDFATTTTIRGLVDHLPWPPEALQPVWRVLRSQVDAAVVDIARRIRELREFAVRACAEAAWQAYRAWFLTESRTITQFLIVQCQQLAADFVLVNAKWGAFEQFAAGVHEALSEADASLAASIAAGSCPRDAVTTTVPDWPEGAVEPLREHGAKQFYQTVSDVRQTATGDVVTAVAVALADQLAPLSTITRALDLALEGIELALGGAAFEMRATVVAGGVVGLPVLAVTGKAAELWQFQQQIGDAHREYVRCSDEWQEIIRSLGTTIDQLPQVVAELRPYLESAFFSDAMIESTYDALIKCRNLADRSHLAFGEIGHQLDDHAAAAVDALGERAVDLGSDLRTAAASVRSMVA